MAFKAVPLTVKVCLYVNLVGHEVTLCWHVKFPGGATTAAVNETAESVIAWWETNASALLAAQVQFDQVRAQDISVEFGYEKVITTTTVPEGTRPGNSLPNNTALVISWRTALVGRSYRGRTYLAGMPGIELLTANDFDLEYQGAVRAAALNLISRFELLGGFMVVVSRFANGVERVTPVTTVVNDVIVNQRIDTQRRRLRGAI